MGGSALPLMTSAILYFPWLCPFLMNVLDVKTAMLQACLRPLVSGVGIHCFFFKSTLQFPMNAKSSMTQW